jgi:peptidylprolyl isomerase
MFAPYTGFIDGFPAARDDKKAGKAWLTHCPGAIAMARNDGPNTGSTDFYIVIGQAPRYLDRNLTIFGRVVWGMDVVQRIKRGPTLKNGIIEEDLDRTWIKRMRLASSLEESEQLDIWLADTNSKGFKTMLNERRNRNNKFFHHKPPKVLDICQVPVPVRLEKHSVLRP